jgi:cell division protein FtsQ
MFSRWFGLFRNETSAIPMLAGRRRRWRIGSLGRALSRVPGLALVALLMGGVVSYGVVRGGHYERMVATSGQPHEIAARLAGLGVGRVTLSGLIDLNEQEVLRASGITPLSALPFIDVAEVRGLIETLPLVKEASVRKLYPNEIVISVTEREAHAIWQNHGELSVIAADGTVIDRTLRDRHQSLPFVVGEGANERLAEYLAILAAAGPLRERIRAGTLVSDRRWTLKLDNGLDVRLPDDDVAGALRRLEKLEREGKILERDVLAIDLRQPDRVTLRLSEEAAAARAELLKKKPGKGGDA